MENKNIKQNELDKILSSIFVHLDPDMLICDYKDKINTNNLNNKKLEEYNILLSNINYFLRKY